MAKYKTKGLIAKFATANPPTTQTIIQLGDSSLEFGERDALINVTTHDTSTGTHEFLDPGFKSPASFSGEILYDPADQVHEDIRSAFESGNDRYLLLTLPDTGAATILFKCRVKSMSMPLPVMGKMVLNVQLEGLASTTFTP